MKSWFFFHSFFFSNLLIIIALALFCSIIAFFSGYCDLCILFQFCSASALTLQLSSFSVSDYLASAWTVLQIVLLFLVSAFLARAECFPLF